MTLVDPQTGEVVESDRPTLAELEQRIERGLESFVDVGSALLSIKAGKRYREAGYSTFEDYCQRRWAISRRHGYRLLLAATTVEALARDLPEEMGPTGHILPTTERQVRPLTRLPEDERPEAWAEAAEEAAAEERQPTAADVERAVERRRPKTTVTERKSYSRKTETDEPAPEADDGPGGGPPSPPGSVDHAEDEAVAINQAFERHVDPAADYRLHVTKRLDAALNLKQLDIEKAVATAGDSADGHRLSVESIRDWCESYLAAARPNRLRRVK